MERYPSELESFLFDNGELKEAYKLFGAHVKKDENGHIVGTTFTVYAPHARNVCVMGGFNGWNDWSHQLKRVSDMGIWSLYVPGVSEYISYKYAIYTHEGHKLEKADPYAYYSEKRPHTASVTYDLDGYEWNDSKWIESKKNKDMLKQPISIYEVHLGSWRRKDGNEFIKYNELVDQLIPYVVAQGFTHIELMPVMEHPLDMSWGYQLTGYYSATSRYGTPKDLMYFIDQCHQNGIGVIMDWVPGHFCKDAHGLFNFDGQPLYEYPFDDIKENKEWGTANFDLGSGKVRSFLISNALFWMDYYHIDGMRIDAVANIIYHLGNKNKGENQGAIEFLKMVNTAIFERDPKMLMMAEDSTDFPKVTEPVYNGGLGFNYKWNMGWMNDTLDYFERDSVYKKYHHNEMTFGMMYAYSEKFVLPLSHDEVVHGKKSLIDKMPGDYFQKFANYRTMIGNWVTFPGKKLMFMGGEFAQFHEWKDDAPLDWFLLDYPAHSNSLLYFKDMLHIYKNEPALYENDHDPHGFSWIDADNSEQSIFTYVRRADNADNHLVIVVNATPNAYTNYKIGVPNNVVYKEIMSSDNTWYGGSGLYNGAPLEPICEGMHGMDQHVEMTIGPLSIHILKPQKIVEVSDEVDKKN